MKQKSILVILISFIIIAGIFRTYILMNNNSNVPPSQVMEQEIHIKAPTPVDQESIGANHKSSSNEKAKDYRLDFRPGNLPVLADSD